MYKVEDNRLDTFRQICASITAEQDPEDKTDVLKKFFQYGIDQAGFKGDLLLWVKMLLRHHDAKRDIKLRKPQLLKYFSRLFDCGELELIQDLELELSISETLWKFFAASVKFPPHSKSTLYLQDVDKFLQKLEDTTKEVEQFELLKKFCQKLTALDLKTVFGLVMKEPRCQVSVRVVLDAIAVMAYPTYVSKWDLEEVVLDFGSNIMKNARDRQMKDRRNMKYCEICCFVLTLVFVYTFLLYLRHLYLGN